MDKLDTLTETAGIMRKATKLPPHNGKHKRLVNAGYAHKGGGEYRGTGGDRVFVEANGTAHHFVAERASA